MPTLSTTLTALLALVPLSAHAFQVTAPGDPALCAPIPLTWTSDSTAPYKIYIVHDGQPIENALETFTVASGTSATWIADIGPPGTFLTVVVEDAQAVKAFSGRLTVQPGTDNCTVTTTGAGNVVPANTGTSTSASATSGTAPPVLAMSTTGGPGSASLSPAATLAVSSAPMPSTSQTQSTTSSGAGASASADPSVKANSAAGSLATTVLVTFGAAVAFAGVGAALL
ncbi:hypothetical protein DENSPDRAFT_500586 [Dentipellis sp. KUC8613]|nr:hypothetical protein DENSPDRAFT_500586 [Dentipellis sp. KUC8613]